MEWSRRDLTDFTFWAKLMPRITLTNWNYHLKRDANKKSTPFGQNTNKLLLKRTSFSVKRFAHILHTLLASHVKQLLVSKPTPNNF